MELIKLFLVGSSGYLLAGLYDISILYNKPLLRKLLYGGFFLTAVPYPVIFYTQTSPHPSFIIWILIGGIVIFSCLLIFSSLLEHTLCATEAGTLYDKGTYSISRHPGFVWYTIVNSLVSIFCWDFRITLLLFGLTLCNFILITIEDLISFPRMFPGYQEYKTRTPFLL